MYGGNGADLLIGGKGDDFLSGDQGADVFEFGNLGADFDTIAGFEPGIDKIHLSGGLAVIATSEANGSTTLALSNGGSILLSVVLGAVGFDLLTSDLPLSADGLPVI